MNTRSKALLIFSGLMILSMVVAACQPAAPTPETIVETVIVEGTPQTVIITATPAPEEPTAPEPVVAEGPIEAEGLVACQPLPELAFAGEGAGAAARTTGPVVSSSSAAPAPRPAAQTGENVYRVGVFEDVTTLNFWAANGPDNTVWNSYMLPPRLAMFSLSDKYFTFVPGIAAVAEPDPLAQEGDFWVTTVPVRQDVVWSDGEQLDAEDVAFTANAVLGLGLISGNWSTWYDGDFLDRVEAVDQFTVKYYYHTKPGLLATSTAYYRPPLWPSTTGLRL